MVARKAGTACLRPLALSPVSDDTARCARSPLARVPREVLAASAVILARIVHTGLRSIEIMEDGRGRSCAAYRPNGRREGDMGRVPCLQCPTRGAMSTGARAAAWNASGAVTKRPGQNRKRSTKPFEMSSLDRGARKPRRTGGACWARSARVVWSALRSLSADDVGGHGSARPR